MSASVSDVFVFVGDSITDAGRMDDPENLGFGYVRLMRDIMLVNLRPMKFDVRNRGVGGDTIRHLDQRWDRDVLREMPTWLCVSIGVNDVWRQLQNPPNPEAVLVDEFETRYRELLDRTRLRCPECRVMLCEPTVIGEDADSPHNQLMPPYLNAVRRLADRFNATLVPMNQAFWRVKRIHPSIPLTSDGVHPLSCGHMLMALTFWNTWERLL